MSGVQMPMFEPESTWVAPSLGNLPDWRGVKRIGFDVETCDPNLLKMGPGVRRDGRMVGYSFCLEDGPKYYIPFGHAGGGNLDKEQALGYLRKQAKDFDGTLVGMNLSYDLDYAAQEGAAFSSVKGFRDIQIADALINELHNSYSMDAICERWNVPGKNEQLLREAIEAFSTRKMKLNLKADLWRLPAKFVGAYGEDDAEIPLRVLRKQEREIEEQDLWDIFNLESEVQPVLVKFARRGVKIDQDKLAQVKEWSVAEETKAIKEIKDKTGYDVGVGNCWKAEALVPALEKIGVQIKRDKKGKASVDQELLSAIGHPVADAIAWARKTNKLRTTFAASVERLMTKEGRLHPSYNQLPRDKGDSGGGGDIKGARFGRLSSENPNIQQQPSRDEFAVMWRSIYLPDEGGMWLCADYSQQEPRMTTHYAYLAGIQSASAAVNAYRTDPLTDNHQMMSDLTGVPRKLAKIIFLGLCYGMGGAKLSRGLGLSTRWLVSVGRNQRQYFDTRYAAAEFAQGKPTARMWEVAGEEAQAILDKFNGAAGYVGTLSKKCEEAAQKRGFIRTLLGRKCRFPLDDNGSYDWTYRALNRLIQGSAADQTKRAMVEVDRAGYDMQMQVHDELDGTVYSVKEAKAIGEIMENCVKLEVPNRVDIEIGPNWGEIKAVA